MDRKLGYGLTRLEAQGGLSNTDQSCPSDVTARSRGQG